MKGSLLLMLSAKLYSKLNHSCLTFLRDLPPLRTVVLQFLPIRLVNLALTRRPVLDTLYQLQGPCFRSKHTERALTISKANAGGRTGLLEAYPARIALEKPLRTNLSSLCVFRLK